MSSWMVSISELLLLARKLNATLVEPCMLTGRLVPCEHADVMRLCYEQQALDTNKSNF